MSLNVLTYFILGSEVGRDVLDGTNSDIGNAFLDFDLTL